MWTTEYGSSISNAMWEGKGEEGAVDEELLTSNIQVSPSAGIHFDGVCRHQGGFQVEMDCLHDLRRDTGTEWERDEGGGLQF